MGFLTFPVQTPCFYIKLHGMRTEGTRTAAHKLCRRMWQCVLRSGTTEELHPGMQPRGGWGHRLGSHQPPSPIPPGTPASPHQALDHEAR